MSVSNQSRNTTSELQKWNSSISKLNSIKLNLSSCTERKKCHFQIMLHNSNKSAHAEMSYIDIRRCGMSAKRQLSIQVTIYKKKPL